MRSTRSSCLRSSTPILDREKTRDAYRLEVDLLPMVLEMRRRGIRIDQDAAEQARDQLLGKRDAALDRAFVAARHRRQHGRDQQQQMEGEDLRRKRHQLSAHAEGQPIILGRQIRMDGETRALAAARIAIASKYDAAGTKFIEGHILNHIVNGRIHAEIHPYRADDGGTRSSRFSYSNPPLQQMPARDKELGPLIRSVFLPEEGEIWAKPDVAQQEFRLVVHYAKQHGLRGAQEAADAYRNNPDADFHAVVAEMTGLDRDAGQGNKLRQDLRRRREEDGRDDRQTAGGSAGDRHAIRCASCRSWRGLSTICQEKASRIGYTVLYDGARRHWNLWEVPRTCTPRAPARAKSKKPGAASPTPSIPGTASG